MIARTVAILLIFCTIPFCTGVDENYSSISDVSRITLPAPDEKGTLTVIEALRYRRSIRSFADTPLTQSDLSNLLWSIQGITDPQGFRTTPSAGALYPLLVTVAIADVEGIPPGAYRYNPQRHDIQKIRDGDLRPDLCSAALDQQSVGEAPVTIIISGVYEITRTRYGDRAERYILMEAGHASQNCYLIATSGGLGTVAIGAFDEAAIQEIMGLSKDEIPLYLMPVGKRL
ncbi:MAG: SagB/ThcOx family dehydrogenase [Methanocalculus sp.]|uniref:SagB/ThcOx family dehydrogenase n=1 Tax=Methanocalculus sp. TaxID=2004547 RepID=UPI0027180B9F|nr:SagB/ThcOx family dehydrogenase [Methanocalculus sp.]MDO9539157.1 SagB/ThcOx family dehydrogenase [Methanocalculus sp.]